MYSQWFGWHRSSNFNPYHPTSSTVFDSWCHRLWSHPFDEHTILVFGSSVLNTILQFSVVQWWWFLFQASLAVFWSYTSVFKVKHRLENLLALWSCEPPMKHVKSHRTCSLIQFSLWVCLYLVKENHFLLFFNLAIFQQYNTVQLKLWRVWYYSVFQHCFHTDRPSVLLLIKTHWNICWNNFWSLWSCFEH